MTRLRTRLAGALAVPLVLTACGAVSSAAAGLEQDAAAANAALAEAEGIGVVVRFADPDGDLEQALQEGPDGLSADLAEVVVGSRVDVRLAAKDGRTLGDQPDPGTPLGQQLRWTDSALTLSTANADLLSWRTVGGVLYVSSDLAEVERVTAAAGSPLSLQDEVAGAPAPLPELHDAWRDGQAVSVPIADLLESLSALAGQDEGVVSEQLPDDLLDELRAAVEPHARLRDLGSDDGVRTVTVEVDVKRLLQAAARTSGSGIADAADLDGLSDETVSGTITLEDGRYRRLELPLSELAGLAEDPSVQVPDLGDSALVVELDDTVEQVAVPTRVAELDLLELLGSDSARPTAPEGSAADAALVACFEQAETPEELTGCSETA